MKHPSLLALIASMFMGCSEHAVDHEDIYAEVRNDQIREASLLMMWALRSDPKYKWVELRAKPGTGDILLVVRHTKPKQEKQ